MTTRMYYPHQQAVARHPENKKKLLSTYFSEEAVSKFAFCHSLLRFAGTNAPPFYISHAISQKKGSTELCSALPNRLTNYKFIIQKLPSANRHETVDVCTLCPNLQGAI